MWVLPVSGLRVLGRSLPSGIKSVVHSLDGGPVLFRFMRQVPPHTQVSCVAFVNMILVLCFGSVKWTPLAAHLIVPAALLKFPRLTGHGTTRMFAQR